MVDNTAAASPHEILKGKTPPVSLTPKRKRHWGLMLSFLAIFVVPTIAAIIYFSAIASDRYAADAGFSIRSMEQQGGLDLFGGITGMAASGSTMADAYIVMAFLTSRSLVEKLEADLSLRELYSSDLADPLYRIDRDIPIEKLVEHWASRITVTHDTSSGIIEFEIDAYTPEDARRLADRVLYHVEELVNNLSAQARHDALHSARSEAERAEERLSRLMLQLQAFRSSNGDIDPATTAGARMELVASLEGQLSAIEARISAARQELDEDAPTVQALRRQAEALQAQIDAKKDNRSGDLSLKSQMLSEYETLQIEKTFAQQAYASAMSSLEAARINADAQQRYLAKFKTPSLPEYAIYPQRALNIFVYAIVFFAAWLSLSLITYSIRDHVS